MMVLSKIRFMSATWLLSVLLVMVTTVDPVSGAGKVYLVLGSDTAIWDGMNVGEYNCYYNPSLYTDPDRNAYGVMDPGFRSGLVDSYGQPMKLTWWMMAGSIFRPGSNTNVPYPNVMTMYLMKKYHGDRIEELGDELTLHYHNFKWTDYDGDGRFWWNQTLSFGECYDDFDYVLAQLLIEEEVFPVSFRSGWHYMDNGWQHRLDQLLPYCMHNDWPRQRVDTDEPLDNTYDWSLAPGQFVPYHPSPENYQLPGNGPGWNVRSTHLSTAHYQGLIDSIFARAYAGTDQLACIWGHLPEGDFLTNLEIIDNLAHSMEDQYPGVTFRYCTAVEAMQLWQGLSDTIPPVLTFEQIVSGEEAYFRISTSEPIFQPEPFVAVKDIYEGYRVLPCEATGTNVWETAVPVEISLTARAAAAVCDSLGNQSLAFIGFRPGDVYVDNEDPGYTELTGNWSSVPADVWGVNYRLATIPAGDSATVRWMPGLAESARYNVEIRVPPLSDCAEDITFRISEGGQTVDRVVFSEALPAEIWNYISTVDHAPENQIFVEVTARSGTAARTFAADVVKFSALVRDRHIVICENHLDFGEIVVNDTTRKTLIIENRGVEPLTISGITAVNGMAGTDLILPLVIPAMNRRECSVYVFPQSLGILSDTLRIMSDDPSQPELKLPVSGEVQNPFYIVDNEDSTGYTEHGDWHFSNAQAYGPSSRYAFLSNNAWAAFRVIPEQSGRYDLYEIVPVTQNATDNALYRISIDDVPVDSVFLDQNACSGNWILIGRYDVPADAVVEVAVMDVGGNTAGSVLRADAVKLALVEAISHIADEDEPGIPGQYLFRQNVPNPFNALTVIRYHVPVQSEISIRIYDITGRLVRTLYRDRSLAGEHQVQWNGTDDSGIHVSSGVYLCRFDAGNYSETMRMMVLR